VTIIGCRHENKGYCEGDDDSRRWVKEADHTNAKRQAKATNNDQWQENANLVLEAVNLKGIKEVEIEVECHAGVYENSKDPLHLDRQILVQLLVDLHCERTIHTPIAIRGGFVKRSILLLK